MYAAANISIFFPTQAHVPSNFMRTGKQLGGIDAILGTNGVFKIVYHGEDTYDVALQISRNLQQYFFADSSVASSK